MAMNEISADLLTVGYEVTRNTVFSKNDIINAFLRAGVPVESVTEQAQVFMDIALAAQRIRPLNSKPDKYTRKV